MKIAHFIWSFTTGGIENMLIDISNEQVETCSIYILCINSIIDKDLVSKLDKRVFFYSCGRNKNSKSILPWIKLNVLIRKIRPDIMHFHVGGIAKFIFYHGVKLRTVHNTNAPLSDLKHYDLVCAISKHVEKYIKSGWYGREMVVYNGIRPELIKKKENHNINNKIVNLVSVGRLHKDKGQLLLVEAVAKLVKDYNVKDFHLDLIGDGELKSQIKDKIKELDIDKYISLLGLRDRFFIYNTLSDYDLYVLPSVSEGFGLTLAEAICAKIPVLTANLDGPMEVIRDGQYGASFEAGNVDSLTQSLYETITNGSDKALIKEAYEFVVKTFDVRKTASSYLDVYNTLIMQSR